MGWLHRSAPDDGASVVSQHWLVTWTPPCDVTGLAMAPCGLVHRHFSVRSCTVTGEIAFSSALKLVRPGSAAGSGQHAAKTTAARITHSPRNARVMTPPPGPAGHPRLPRLRTCVFCAALYSAPIGALSLTLDATFFALSDPTRRGILERLGRGPATLSQLARPAGLTLNGIKKHGGILEHAGLVETEKVGRARQCRLGPAPTLGEAGEWIEDHRRAWQARVDRFGRFAEQAE